MPFSLLRAPIPISTGFCQSLRYGDSITLYWSRPCALRHARHRDFLICHSQPHQACEGLVELHPPYVPMADALYAWRHVSSHAPGRHACAFAKHHQTIIQLVEGRIHRQRGLARPTRSVPISVAMRVWGELGRGISVVTASRDASGCIIEHTKSARPPNHIDSHPVARAIPFT